jgi:hypothetical protein
MDLPWSTIKGVFDYINTFTDDTFTVIVRSGVYNEPNAINIACDGYISMILEGDVVINFTGTDGFIVDATTQSGVVRILHFSISSTIKGTKGDFSKGPGLSSVSGVNMFVINTNKTVNTGLTEIFLSLNNISVFNVGSQPIINIAGQPSDNIDIKVRIENSTLRSDTTVNTSSLIQFDSSNPSQNILSLNVSNSVLDSTGPQIDLQSNPEFHNIGLSNNTFIYRGSDTYTHILTNSKAKCTFNNNIFFSEVPFQNYLWIDLVNDGRMITLGHQLGNLNPNILSGITVFNSGGIIESSDIFDPRDYMSEWV